MKRSEILKLFSNVLILLFATRFRSEKMKIDWFLTDSNPAAKSLALGSWVPSRIWNARYMKRSIPGCFYYYIPYTFRFSRKRPGIKVLLHHEKFRHTSIRFRILQCYFKFIIIKISIYEQVILLQQGANGVTKLTYFLFVSSLTLS